MSRIPIALSGLLLGSMVGCVASVQTGDAGAGGSDSGPAGARGTGGAAGSGGATGAGGRGGAPDGAGGSGAGGRGGQSGAGSAGSTGAAAGANGSDGGASPAVPSAGCARMTARPPNGTVSVANDHIYDFPASYDGRTPLPLLMALHAAGNSNTQLEGISNGTRLATSFVRAFPKSAGSAWVYATDAQKVVSAYTDLTNNYCIDTSRVFLTGHSSGAQMAVQIVCNGDTRYKAVAPVAASRYCTRVMPTSVMYIQGMMDAMRNNSNGADVVAVFTASNQCSITTMPFDVPTCTSATDRMTVTPGCVSYQGCSKPTIWCSHNDHGYNLTDGYEHGWPCFASNAIADFFLALP
ncbi:MAG TPA: hypothetical protein VFH68_20025 [Polyangia bacterium]|jgi:poly(3-hydroxybutyrate) depolymerase|nr:hypothetical protein [Polyangia bacterium]